jgi:hypothetical protein
MSAAALELLVALRQAEELLTNLQPHIPQACMAGRSSLIDGYVDPALEIIRAAIAKAQVQA